MGSCHPHREGAPRISLEQLGIFCWVTQDHSKWHCWVRRV